MLPMDPIHGNGAPAAVSKRSSPDDAAKPASKRKKVPLHQEQLMPSDPFAAPFNGRLFVPSWHALISRSTDVPRPEAACG